MRDLDPEFIQSELGELLRMAASIMTPTVRRHSSSSASVQPRATRGSIVRVRSGDNGGTRYTCATMPSQPPFRRSVNRILVRGNPSTNSSGSFTPVLFASIAGADGMRKS